MPGTRVETIVIILASALAEQKWQILSTVIAAYVSWCLASDKSFDLLDYCTPNGQVMLWSRMLSGYASVLRSITVLPDSDPVTGKNCGHRHEWIRHRFEFLAEYLAVADLKQASELSSVAAADRACGHGPHVGCLQPVALESSGDQ